MEAKSRLSMQLGLSKNNSDRGDLNTSGVVKLKSKFGFLHESFFLMNFGVRKGETCFFSGGDKLGVIMKVDSSMKERSS